MSHTFLGFRVVARDVGPGTMKDSRAIVVGYACSRPQCKHAGWHLTVSGAAACVSPEAAALLRVEIEKLARAAMKKRKRAKEKSNG